MDLTIRPYLVLGGIFIISLLQYYVTTKRRSLSHLPLPPGPKGFPIIGSLFDMPSEKPWLVYDRWSKIYGDMVYFKVLGQGYLILGTLTAVNDLFEKRSSNYSDRPRMPMLELMDYFYMVGILPYGPWWRRHRRMFHEHFHRSAVTKYLPIQHKETKAFLRRLLVTPENFRHHIRHTFSATIMEISYGIRVSESNDPYISNAEEALDGLAQAVIPGKFLVDLLPILKYVPSWMPGASFKQKAAHWKAVNLYMAEKPFNHVKEALRQGTAVRSIATTLIEALPGKDDEQQSEEEQLARNVVAVAYAGGADTTVSAVQSFFLAMAMYPEVQHKAQAEIDATIGSNRLPDYNDRESLPYINAVAKEAMRWQVVAPLAIGHMCSSDDEYNGYFIPKGTVVVGNAWAILHDPVVYPDPEEFKPERWLKDGRLNPDVQEPTVAAFGFGRRICPGRYLSDNSLYAIIALTLSVYNIRPPIDDRGNVVHLKPEMTSGALSYPVSFECIIKPRSLVAEALIRNQDID